MVGIMDGDLGMSTIKPPIPDAWIMDPTSNPNAGISRLCWGWRSSLEVAVRESDAETATRLVRSHCPQDVRAFAECSLLLCKACARGSLDVARLLVEEAGCDVDGLHHSDHAPRGDDDGRSSGRMRAIREWRGYNGCTPLFGASQGDPGVPLEGRVEVARYLLGRGADPMLPNDPGITPLFIASVSNALPIVRAMIDTGRCDLSRPIPDGETPLSIVRTCRRDKKGGPDGFPDYQPMLELLESAAAKSGVMIHSGERPVDRATHRKELGNDAFMKKKYKDAAAHYRTALEMLEEQVVGTGVDNDSEMKALRVTLLSNRAEALLQLGSCFRAEEECEAALALDPDHAKTKSRQTRSHRAVRKYRDAKARYDAKHMEYSRAAEENAFLSAAERAAELAAIAKGLDPLHISRSMNAEAQVYFFQARENNAPGYYERAAQAANDALILCHEYEKRGLEIDYADTADDRTASGQLHVEAACSWLTLGKIDKEEEGGNDLKGARVKLHEALGELEKGQAEIGHSFIVYQARMHVWEQIVELAEREGRWDFANATVNEMLEVVDDLAGQDGGDDVFRCFAPFVVSAASSLATGGTTTRSVMCRAFHVVAARYTALNEVREAALVYRKLINCRHSSWGLKDVAGLPDSDEAKKDADDVAELVSLLKRMGREDSDTCSICLGSLDSTVVDVLTCLHMFHPACVREIFQKYPASLDQKGDMIVSSGQCPTCRTKVQMCCFVRQS